jgi:hypothetical protein
MVCPSNYGAVSANVYMEDNNGTSLAHDSLITIMHIGVAKAGAA